MAIEGLFDDSMTRPPPTRGRRGLSLRWRLILLVISSTVPLLAFSLGYQYYEYRDDVAATGVRTLALADHLASQIEADLQARIDALGALSTSDALRTGDIEGFRHRAEEVVATEFPGANILVLDRDGQILMNTLSAPGSRLSVRANLESFHRALATGRPAVSDLFKGAASRRPLIAIDVPVKARDGHIAYVLSMNPPLKDFADFVLRQRLSAAWFMAIFDSSGRTVARVPNGDRFIGEPASAAIIGPLHSKHDGIIENASREGIPLLSAFSHGPRFGWAVAIGIPRKNFVHPIMVGVRRTLGIGAALLILAMGLAAYVAHSIARPIGSLRRLATVKQNEPFPDLSSTGLPEVDETALAFYFAESERRRSRAAESILRDGVESIPEGFAIYDAHDRLVMCNENYRNLFPGSPDRVKVGVSFAELLRTSLTSGEIAAPDGDVTEWVAARVRDHLDPDAAAEQQTPDGRWALVRNRRISTGGVVGLRIDISALKAAQHALQAGEERFRRVVEAVPTALLTVDASGRIDMVNAEAERIFLQPRERLTNQSIDVLLPERYRAHHPALRASFAAAPQTRQMGAGRDLYALRGDGSEFPVEVGLSPFQGGTGPMVLVSVIDITERKHAEQQLHDEKSRTEQALAALRQSQDQLKSAQRLAQMGSDIRNLQTDDAEWSDEMYRIFGVTRETYVPSTENFLTLVHPDDRATLLATREQIRLGKTPGPFEYRIIRPDGAVRHIYRENELIRDEEGTPVYLVGTCHDVTERRETEQQLRQSQKMEAIGNLTGGMAHDFNNLLGIVIGNLGLARDQIGEDDELREMIADALDAAWRGADLTRRLLAFARRQPLRPQRIDVNELVAEAVRLLKRVLGEQIEIRLDLAAEVWPVTADPAQLEAALTNLATNARDAMPRGGRLTFITANRRLDAAYAAEHADATEGDFAMICVTDTGAGMAPEVMSRIFEPFFTTKEAGKGTGLGLSMVFGFMRQTGGHVSVYSEPQIGTTFRLYLPRDPEAALSIDNQEEARIEAGGGETVLLVEDNAGMRRIALRQLRGLGYRVLDCELAAEALDTLTREHVDLLLTDIVMPGGMDGVELARLASERWPSLKVVLTSGFPQARLDLGDPTLRDLPLLSKPYSQEELASALHAALHG